MKNRKNKKKKSLIKSIRGKIIKGFFSCLNKILKGFFGCLLKLLPKLLVACGVAFIATFVVYITNTENKLIYYVVRPLLNKHYDSQVRDRKV
ncbi:MAG: hypothetical protein K6B75_05200 [Lachnospiraceae bacterium]|nr:hypothetical protein [Lachnospiraceae bacterium]